MAIDIHATVGPASFAEEVIRDLILAGANVFRINLSHSPRHELPALIERIRGQSRLTGKAVRIGPDIRGRKLRIGALKGESVTLREGEQYVLHCVPEGEELQGDESRAWVNHPLLPATLAPGVPVLLDDGALRLVVTHVEDDALICTIEVGGPLPERSGVNVPGLELLIPALGPKDLADLDAIASLDVDFVYLSYVESASDIETLRDALSMRGRSLPVVAKIERAVAIDRIDSIAAAADAICLARGDLGVEVPLADIPFLQRDIVRQTHAAGKPFILAGEVLYSMIGRQIPARAELTDVAIAVEQRVDGFILSDETAVGIAPVTAVSTLINLIRGAERHLSA